MTNNIKLLPLPGGNVAHLIAAQDAEIKALRADVRTCEEQVCQTVYICQKRDIITTVGC